MNKRYVEEIEEILEQADTDQKHVEYGADRSMISLVVGYTKQSLWRKPWVLSPGGIMVFALSLMLVALIMRAVIPSLVGPLAWLGLLVFIVGYGLFFVRSPKGNGKRWRGQDVSDVNHETQKTWLDEVRRFFRSSR